MQKLTYAFDLDGTLCTLTHGEYEKAEPLINRIEHVNQLHRAGHIVLIFTARGAASGRDLREFTLNQMELWGLQYSELIMGKPHFDLLVDDKATHSDQYFWNLN